MQYAPSFVTSANQFSPGVNGSEQKLEFSGTGDGNDANSIVQITQTDPAAGRVRIDFLNRVTGPDGIPYTGVPTGYSFRGVFSVSLDPYYVGSTVVYVPSQA